MPTSLTGIMLPPKLIWIQDYQSHMQIEDIKSIVTIEGLDWNYITKWIKQLKLRTFNLINR